MRHRSAIRWALAFVLLASVVPTAFAADNAAVVGKWTASMSPQGQPVEATVELKETDGVLGGTWTGKRGPEPLTDVKWDGQELTFSRAMNRRGKQARMVLTAKVQGDTMDGKIAAGQREFPFTAKRAS